MGLRTASVRRLSSVAMAPALTETNTFKLTPKTSATCNQSSAATGVDVDVAFDDTDTHTAASTTNQTTAIVRKGVKGDAEAPFDLTHLQLAADFLNKGDITLERCKLPPTDNGIMNNPDLTIHPNLTVNMGLQQQTKEDKSIDGQQHTTIVDHMFANLPPLHTDDEDLMQQMIKSIESGVVDSNEELTEELVEELPLNATDLIVASLQPENLSSLEKALFNAVDIMNMGGMVEQMMVDQPPINVDKRDERSRELLAQVQSKQARLERKHDFLLRRLRKIQMRYMGQHVSAEIAGVYEHVHRTLRRLKEQGNTVPPPSTTQQPQEDASDSAPATASFDSSSAAALDLSVSAQTAKDGKGSDGEVLKPISHGAAKSLVKKLENTRHLQATSASRQRHSARFFGSGSIEPTSFRTPTTSSSSSTLTLLPPWPAADKTSLQQTAGQLRAQVALLQGQLDSDATVSSSGGESCDEMTVYGNVHQQYLAIQKRAAWNYSSARASIASRWSWLLAQIADLEYRIKQHNDLQRNIRSSKGPVILSHALPVTIATTTNAAVNGYRGVLPGDSKGEGTGTAGVSLSTPTDHSAPINTSTTCARIRPLNTSTFTKRRLVQTGGLHMVSKKAARPSTVRCACIADISSSASVASAKNRNAWGVSNCAVCTGRSDPTLPRDPTDHLSRMERIALLDGGYHPVVSLPEDTSISVHMEAIMKSVEWQQRSSRSSLKAMKYAIKADRMNSDRSEKYQQSGSSAATEPRERTTSGKKGAAASAVSEHRRKYNKISGGSTVKGSTVNALTAKLKAGRPRGRKPNSSRHNNSVTHKKRRRHSHHHQRSREHSASYSSYNASSSLLRDSDDDDYLGDDDYVGQKDAIDQYVIGQHGGGSRSGSPLLATQSISGFGRRNRVDSYDIDNIVIPYSVAASTRVERLQYKEILTPKWRMVDTSNLPPIKYESKNNGVVKITSQENEVSDVEDISEDSVQVRHDKSEQEEKRKFLSYLKLPFGYYTNPASRRHYQSLHHNNNHKRTDSRAESSGANTPDNPMSPAPTNINLEAAQQQQQQMGETPVASPPTIDQLGGNKGEELPEALRNLPLSSLSSLRRRTISSSRWLQRDSTSNDGTEQTPTTPIIEIPPFDRRQFPLSEENYDKMVRGMPEGHRRGTVNVRNQDNSDTELKITASSSSLPATKVESVRDSTVTADPRRRRSTQQTTTTAVVDHGHAGCSIIDDIDSESTESAFGDEDPNDPEWDLEDQISRNSHDAMGRFRR